MSGCSGLCLKPIPDPNKIRVRRVDPNITHTRLAQTHTRIIISGSGSGSRVELVLPGLDYALWMKEFATTQQSYVMLIVRGS